MRGLSVSHTSPSNSGSKEVCVCVCVCVFGILSSLVGTGQRYGRTVRLPPYWELHKTFKCANKMPKAPTPANDKSPMLPQCNAKHIKRNKDTLKILLKHVFIVWALHRQINQIFDLVVKFNHFKLRGPKKTSATTSNQKSLNLDLFYDHLS